MPKGSNSSSTSTITFTPTKPTSTPSSSGPTHIRNTRGGGSRGRN